MSPLAYLDDPVSRIAAGGTATVGSIYALAAQSPLETLAGALAALLVPVLISAINRWISERHQATALRASLRAAEATADELRRRLAELEAGRDGGGQDR